MQILVGDGHVIGRVLREDRERQRGLWAKELNFVLTGVPSSQTEKDLRLSSLEVRRHSMLDTQLKKFASCLGDFVEQLRDCLAPNADCSVVHPRGADEAGELAGCLHSSCTAEEIKLRQLWVEVCKPLFFHVSL